MLLALSYIRTVTVWTMFERPVKSKVWTMGITDQSPVSSLYW